MTHDPENILLRATDLTKYYPAARGPTGRRSAPIPAVAGIDISIEAGRTTALVGESGCGKSTTGRLLLGLEAPTGGRVEYRGQDLASMDANELRAFRRRAQIVFQDPFASLNPRMTVGVMLREVMSVHGIARAEDAVARIDVLLGRVGLPKDAAVHYPHEFSGGQRQRIGIARALRNSSCLTNQCLHWMSRYKHRFSTCYEIYKQTSDSPTCSFPTISAWSRIWQIGYSSCVPGPS